MPGMLTSGDVDVHVRVATEAFASALDVLSTLYEPFHEDAWTARESAFFVAPGTAPPVEIALTVVGTVDDFHHGEAWDRLAADPQLAERYNEFKRRFETASEGEYDAAKRGFFSESFRGRAGDR